MSGNDAALLKDAVNIRDVVELYGVPVNSRGVCTCPFHDDRHPSASVKNGRFHCYVCDLHIDIFEFVQRITGCGFRDAKRTINAAFRVVADIDAPIDRGELSRLQREREQRQREKAARRAEYDRRTAEYNRLLHTRRPDPSDDAAMGQYAAGLGRIERLDYWFDHHTFER